MQCWPNSICRQYPSTSTTKQNLGSTAFPGHLTDCLGLCVVVPSYFLSQPGNADGITQPQQAAAVSSHRLQEPFQQQQLLQHIGAPWRTQQYSLAAAASRGQQQQQHLSQHPWQHPWQQWQQQRGLLGVVKHKNYQDHNKTKPKKTKIKTPS